MKTRTEILNAFRAKYEALKTVFPKIGAPIKPGIYRTPNGGWQCNYANCAAITIRPGDSEAHEVYGGICKRWYQEGGAFDETGMPGWLGFPISGVEAFHDLGDSKDRISHFENGDIVLIDQNEETRIVNSRISKQEFTETVQKLHEKVVEIIADELGVDKHQISRTTSLCEDLGADELDLMDIYMAFEEDFGVEIPKSTHPSPTLSGPSYYWWDIGESVGEIEQYLLEHSLPSADNKGTEV